MAVLLAKFLWGRGGGGVMGGDGVGVTKANTQPS